MKMSKLALDEAIKHCLEVAEKNECKMTSDDGCTDVSMKRCAAEHRQLAEWLQELKEARKLLTATKYKVEHEEWDMHGEHYIGDYAMCPNCNKNLAIIHNGKAEPTCLYCSDCGQKIDWES